MVATRPGRDAVAATAGPALEVRGVTKRFGGLTAIREVSLRVEAGEVRGLIGPNGAGKTTLFDIISGLTPPTSGTVHLDGSDVTRQMPERRARSGVRRTFQRTQLYGRLSVEDNVLASMEWRGGGGGLVADLVAAPSRRRREAERRERATAVLEACGLADLRHRPAGSLPIGQARLVELARAIADRPRLLLLDEPTSGLSAQETERFGEQIQRLRSDGVAVLLVEHDVGFVMGQSDRVVVLNLGAVLAEGTPDEIQAHPEVRAAYLG
ncbi:ABC transporter ATP-binding protein [Frankia sp. CNm7]|uniref:ABC transporter ATP-binding protein n=1 Tax=Frankia nepalensis TaxID=1836974 RepID=A0A937RDK1_9ACTN|nr:ABC transporter ATP-binding protein [Frankia nepalensis]MBL7500845.1 ABC transporter ATP-binding protein [Frankia nepalensis]MBL7509211.1 ABC transporter ATP-binding protein [Frankia nepalensis]MBL7519480.1 ABC transporter ATP-binding protein [Frankia nepalensis]MBL7627025.1 ABC transporter ATP-binding protein [Frankia nepalensis]